MWMIRVALLLDRTMSACDLLWSFEKRVLGMP